MIVGRDNKGIRYVDHLGLLLAVRATTIAAAAIIIIIGVHHNLLVVLNARRMKKVDCMDTTSMKDVP